MTGLGTGPAVDNERSRPAFGNWGRVWRILTNRHFSPYKIYIDRRQRIAVVLNPKVGTQSIRHALNRGLREFGGLQDVSEGRYWWWKKAREFPLARLRDYVHALRCAEDFSFVCFVRNPYLRLRSAWLDKLAFGHREGYPRSTRRRVLGPLRRFARQQNLPGGEPNAAIPFSSFVAYVESEPTGRRDHHWDEQYSVLIMNELRYANVFQLETQYREGLTHVLSRLGFAPEWIDQLITAPRNTSTRPAEPVFTEELAERARRIYARDFAVFGYDVESWRGL